MQLSPDVDLNDLATECQGLSGAETALIPREAGLKQLTEEIQILESKG